jgi:VCBS repeat-containing protein
MTGSARYVGRIGALAVALGVGMAVAGPPVAWAQTDGSDSSNSGSSGSSNSEAGSPESGGSTDSSGPGNSTGPDESASGTAPSSGADGDEVTGTGAGDELGGDNPEPTTEPESGEPGPSTQPTAPSAAPEPTPTPHAPSGDTKLAVSSTPAPAMAKRPSLSTKSDLVDAQASDVAASAPPPSTVSVLVDGTAGASNSFRLAQEVAPAAAALVAPAAPDPVADSVAATFLSPFINAVNSIVSGLARTVLETVVPEPAGPQTPLLWAVLAFARREIENRLFNLTPVINPTQTSQSEDGVITGTIAEDPDGDPLVITVVRPPEHGTVVINDDGTYTYTPDPAFAHTGSQDSFAVTVVDAGLHLHSPLDFFVNVIAPSAEVPIDILAVNRAPIAGNQTVVVDEDGVVDIDVLADAQDTDGDPLTPQLVGAPAHGTATLNADGTFTYTPDANYNGADSFSYAVTDNFGQLNPDGVPDGVSGTAIVSITVNPINDAPVANNDNLTTPKNIPLTITAADVLGNDFDVDGDGLTVFIVNGTGPTHGQLTFTTDSIIYTPNANFTGTDGFSYRSQDTNGAFSNVATVTITVIQVNGVTVVTPSIVV